MSWGERMSNPANPQVDARGFPTVEAEEVRSKMTPQPKPEKPIANRCLRIDLETYSDIDIKKAGAYRYVYSDAFEILIFAYAIDNGPKIVIDLAGDLEDIPSEVIDMLTDPTVTKKAYNANFERLSLGKHLGYVMPPDQWECTAVKGARHGLPGNLDQVAKAISLPEQKDASGKALIKYFSMPCKPTKVNGMRTRNLPFHDWEKWEQYKEYCRQDVVTEHVVDDTLQQNPLSGVESRLWAVDQLINDRGVAVDMQLVDNAMYLDEMYKAELTEEMITITGVRNPNSVQQLQEWLSETCNVGMTSLGKDDVLAKIKSLKKTIETLEYGSLDQIAGFITTFPKITELMTVAEVPKPEVFENILVKIEKTTAERKSIRGAQQLRLWNGADSLTVAQAELAKHYAPPDDSDLDEILKRAIQDRLAAIREIPDKVRLKDAVRVLELRLELAKSSIKKYGAIKEAAIHYIDPTQGSRVHGLLQFYGANRTGRWAGRLVQIQNLARNDMEDLDEARQLVMARDYELLRMIYGSVSNVLSQLIRTAFIPSPASNRILRISDYSAIEARVLAWLANEKWRLDVFASHGKIYEASASMMFNVPLDTIVKGHDNYKLRSQGKVAELALGYGGGENAIEVMDNKKAIPPEDRKEIRDKWRDANKKIVRFWKDVGDAVMKAIRTGNIIELQHGLQFYTRDEYLFIVLPSGRRLAYYGAHIEEGGNRFGGDEVRYWGINDKKQWTLISSYGPKFVENIVQAVSRDCLAVALLRLEHQGFSTVMHIHDEIVCDEEIDGPNTLERMSEIMAEPIQWAPGLLLPAEGYESEYYKKD